MEADEEDEEEEEEDEMRSRGRERGRGEVKRGAQVGSALVSIRPGWPREVT